MKGGLGFRVWGFGYRASGRIFPLGEGFQTERFGFWVKP